MTKFNIINNKINVTFFQRRPRVGFSFSIEAIFNDVRKRLRDRINVSIRTCRFYNDGILTKLYNIVEAGFRQGNCINHITGEVHFLNLLMKRRTVLLTIHDCGFVHRKRGFSRRFVTLLYLTLPVRKSKFITAVSEQTKQQIITYTHCDPEKIVVIPVAVNEYFQPHPKTFNETKPVILQIGTSYNKNLLRLIEALKNISCHLIIVGKLTAEHLNALQAHNIEYSNEYNISNERLLQKYIECDILSFVSTFEGFGMPIVEANIIERVVITSDISSMPETANDAAHFVDPFNVDDIRKGIITLITDKLYREKLLQNGRENRKRFNADNIANLYFKVYKMMVKP